MTPTHESILLATIFLPLLGVGVLWAVAPSGRVPVRLVALGIMLLTLVGTIWLAAEFPADADQFAESDFVWLSLGDEAKSIAIHFSVALDGLSLWLFVLSAVLSITALLASWRAIEDRPAEFYAMLLLLETGMLGVFAARDLLLFYVFFEFVLIPLFFLIGVWGSADRRYAAMKFFLFTLAGSLITFLGLLSVVLLNYEQTNRLTFSIPAITADLRVRPLEEFHQAWIFWALFAGLAIKVPLFPLHTWLPLAHTEAPTAGSVVLAGVLLKIGTYGFLRFAIPWLPFATTKFAVCLLWLAVAGIIYGALVALAQRDMKRLIAYSSVSHLGFCMLGLFALNPLGVQGAILQMVSHGLSTGGLFAIVGMIYERYHTREIAALGGLARRTPRLAALAVLFALASIGLPGLSGFVSELLVLLGMFERGWVETGPLAWQFRVIAVAAVSGVVLGAWYMLWLVERVFFGPLREPTGGDHHAHAVPDLSLREGLALAPLVVWMFWIGLAPDYFLQRTETAAKQAIVSIRQPAGDPPALTFVRPRP